MTLFEQAKAKYEALGVDVEAAFEAVKAAGLTPMTEDIQFLPFWEKGFRFFKVLGPNNEPVEFGQIL